MKPPVKFPPCPICGRTVIHVDECPNAPTGEGTVGFPSRTIKPLTVCVEHIHVKQDGCADCTQEWKEQS